ncbi:MAG: helix-turn-helix transcriptional regulator [Acidimicrobiales bacterium]
MNDPGTAARDARDDDRLEVFKALGDDTRYAIYLELARSATPLATADLADRLELHVNTVRPHLERMRELGLLDLHVVATGGVGRPLHRYSLAHDSPSLGLEPPVFPMLARMLLQMAGDAGVGAVEAVGAGRDQGRRDARLCHADASDCVEAILSRARLHGFDPLSVVDDDVTTIAFTRCPFAELAESDPELVCALHQGMVEGFAAEAGGCAVREFRSLVGHGSCRVELVTT